MPPETAAALLSEGRWLLDQVPIDTAALDARLLFQHAIEVTHEALIAEPLRLVSNHDAQNFRSMIVRRSRHEPVSRIIGRREFYGRDFIVTPAVLDPRPDTETLVEAALSFLPAAEPRSILDLGTGTGAIIVTLLAERPLTKGAATDLSPAALKVASENARRHGTKSRLMLIETSWWQAVSGRFDLVVSNPPYIPHAAIGDLEPEVRDFDPAAALDGGPDGLEAYRRIAAGGAAHLTQGGRILVEIGNGQADAVTATFENQGLAATGQWLDLGGQVRCLSFAFH